MSSKPPPEKTNGLTQRAQMLISLGRSADAVLLLHDALAQSPDDAKTMCLLSQAYSELNQYSEAERWAEQAIAAAPNQEWGYRLLAWHLLDQGAPHTALPPAEEAARLKPEGRRSLYILAKVQRHLKQFEAALETAGRLRAVAPDHYSTHETFALVEIARQQWPQAEQHCRQALQCEPDSWQGLNNLGLALTQQFAPKDRELPEPRFIEGVNCLYHAVRAAPASARPRGNLDKALRRCLLSNQLVGSQFLAFLVLWQDLRCFFEPFSLLTDGLLLLLSVELARSVVRRRRLSHRRFQTLPPDVQAYWRKTWWVYRILGGKRRYSVGR